MANRTSYSIRFIVFTALMAALCYVATMLHIAFSLGGATSSTMIHLGSAVCLLSALLFGGWSGGIASSIGMGLFDIFNGYAMTSPWTFVIKFLMGFTVGKIAWSKGKNGSNQKTNLIACIVGGAVSLVGYMIEDFVNTLITFSVPGKAHTGNAIAAAFATAGSGMVGSILTTVIAIIVAIPLNDSIRKAFRGTNILEPLNK